MPDTVSNEQGLLQKGTSSILHKGDEVLWRGGFGNDAPISAVVISIEVVPPGEKEGGFMVDSIEWDKIHTAVIDLNNGHWAYGDQISRKV